MKSDLGNPEVGQSLSLTFQRSEVAAQNDCSIRIEFHARQNSVPTETVFQPMASVVSFRRIGGEVTFEPLDQ